MLDPKEYMPMVDGAIDTPSIHDYNYNDVMQLWEERQLANEVLHNKTPIYNQNDNNTPNTYYACTIYWGIKWTNENNAYEWSNIITDPVPERAIALQKYNAVIDKWNSLQNALNQLRDRKLISWFARTANKYQMQYALNVWQMIYTGTNQCDWKKTQETWIFHSGQSYGHVFCGIWYNDLWVIFANSYWSHYTYNWIVWCFLMKREDIKYLFSAYALIDFANIDKIKAEKIRKDRESLERMRNLWIYNGLNGDQPVTRDQNALMIDRAMEVMRSESSK